MYPVLSLHSSRRDKLRRRGSIHRRRIQERWQNALTREDRGVIECRHEKPYAGEVHRRDEPTIAAQDRRRIDEGAHLRQTHVVANDVGGRRRTQRSGPYEDVGGVGPEERRVRPLHHDAQNNTSQYGFIRPHGGRDAPDPLVQVVQVRDAEEEGRDPRRGGGGQRPAAATATTTVVAHRGSDAPPTTTCCQEGREQARSEDHLLRQGRNGQIAHRRPTQALVGEEGCEIPPHRSQARRHQRPEEVLRPGRDRQLPTHTATLLAMIHHHPLLFFLLPA